MRPVSEAEEQGRLLKWPGTLLPVESSFSGAARETPQRPAHMQCAYLKSDSLTLPSKIVRRYDACLLRMRRRL